jgi:hypothetical protein
VAVVLSLSWLLDGQFKKIAQEFTGMALAVLTSFFFSSWMLGSFQCWFDWFNAGQSMPTEITPVALGNYSLARLIFDHSGFLSAKYISAALIGIVLFFLWWTRCKVSAGERRGQDDFLRDSLLVGVGCLIYLMAGDLVWGHYYLLTIPALLFLLRPDEKGQAPGRQNFVRWVLALLTFLLLAANPIAVFYTFKTPESIATILIVGTTLLFILVMETLGRPFWRRANT